ncbi:MAG TPA: pantoate kinase [Methanobacteriaceae archaeon]|nr:pantoate kinase [Methanobacteriaceae archaeon]
MQFTVFAPSHITGFFEIVEHPDPMFKGSRGAGVTLDQGVLTSVDVTDGTGEVHIFTNDQEHYPNDSVSHQTFNLLQGKFSDELNWNEKNINIKHEIQVPIEAGFGASAGISLGTALGISRLFKLPLTFNQAAAVAHQTEVELKTGLGDVIGAVNGGMPLRLSPGAPGIGKIDSILIGKADMGLNDEEGLYVITKSLGIIETSSVIGDPQMVKKINTIGGHLLQDLLKNPQIPNFMKLSQVFAQKTGLMDPEVMEIVEVLDDETLGASMAMLGKTAFAISKTPDSSVEDVNVARIDSCGCRFV